MIAKLIARLLCWRYGHPRGKRIAGTDRVACKRCTATWTRKVKVA